MLVVTIVEIVEVIDDEILVVIIVEIVVVIVDEILVVTVVQIVVSENLKSNFS